jgi:hypothetical protein
VLSGVCKQNFASLMQETLEAYQKVTKHSSIVDINYFYPWGAFTQIF